MAHSQYPDCGNKGSVQAWIRGFKSGDTVLKKTLINGQVAAEVGIFKIVSYTVNAFGPGICDEPYELSSTDKNFPELSISLFKKLRPETVVTFENIRARDVNGITVCLRSFFYVVDSDPPGNAGRVW